MLEQETQRASLAEDHLDIALGKYHHLKLTFQVAPMNQYQRLTYEDAILYCFSLGEGWRLPSLDESSQIRKFISIHEWIWIASSNACSLYSGNIQFGIPDDKMLTIPVRDFTDD